jgi:hypothetical protein
LVEAVRIYTDPNEMEPEQIDGCGADGGRIEGEAGRRNRQALRAAPLRGTPTVGSLDRDPLESRVGTRTHVRYGASAADQRAREAHTRFIADKITIRRAMFRSGLTDMGPRSSDFVMGSSSSDKLVKGGHLVARSPGYPGSVAGPGRNDLS